MSAFPSLPLFTDAWVADTKHLTRLERGTYHDLLVLMWRCPECRVPNDDGWLGKRLGMTLTEVQDELRPVIREFIQTDGNWLFQKRLKKEWDYCKKRSKANSDNVKHRWNKEKTSYVRNTDDLVAGITPNPNPNPNLKEKEIDKEKAATRTKKGARIANDWKLEPQDADFANKQGLRRDRMIAEADKFKNYWLAKSGKDASKMDWHATWRTWVLNAVQWSGGAVTADQPQITEAGRELERKTREYEAEIARKAKSNGQEIHTAVRPSVIGSGDERTDSVSDDVFPAFESFHR